MLHLTLVRHAKAEPARSGQDDWGRALDAQGQQEAIAIGRRLRQRAVQPSAVVSSTAVRALSTANLLARELGLPSEFVSTDDRLYLVSATDLLDWVRERDSAAQLTDPPQHLMLVAHNPGLSDFAARIAVNPVVSSLPTAAALTLQFQLEHWGDLRWGSGIDAQLEFPQHRR
jgi:phosphohistidine phosphatase